MPLHFPELVIICFSEVEDDEISREEVQVKKKGSPAKYTAEQGVTPGIMKRERREKAPIVC